MGLGCVRLIDPDRCVVPKHVSNQCESVDPDPLDDLIVGSPVVDFAGQHGDCNGDDHLGSATRPHHFDISTNRNLAAVGIRVQVVLESVDGILERRSGHRNYGERRVVRPWHTVEMALGHDVGEIREAASLGVLDGVTTNPTLVAREGKEFHGVLREIVTLVNGPISAEVTTTNKEEMLGQGRELARIHPNIVVKLPLPPGCLPTLWNNDERYVSGYLSRHPGYYLTGDAGYKDEDDYLWIMSRTDDVINVAGHRLSTGQMEEVLAGHPDVAECAVIGVSDALKGQLPLGLVVLKAGVAHGEREIQAQLVQRMRDHIGPVAAFKLVAVVKRLPKTRSGKILRGTMVRIADGSEWKMPATIDNPAVLDDITAALKKLGYAGG